MIKSKIVAGAIGVGLAMGIAPTALAAPIPGPGYELFGNADGSVARWNPCRPIHYRVNASQGGAGAMDDVFSAVSQLQSASGLQMVYDGPSSQIPQSNYPAGDPNNPNPLLIAWASPSQTDVLGGGTTLGYSGTTMSSWTSPDGVFHPIQITSGYTVFKDANLAGGFGPASYATRGRMLLHELGHVAGLMHVNDSNQVMYPTIDGRTGTYAAGDRAGLARTGSAAGCVGAPAPAPVAVVQPAPPALSWWDLIVSWFQSLFH